jgi:DNA-binding response OmpR family regulator
VLVAEDDEGLGEVLARGLREQGYVVDLVPDGETAAAYLRFYSYEVAVLDWRMPRLSGLDLVRRLRRGGTARLRSKLAGAGARIETVRGAGYRMVAS